MLEFAMNETMPFGKFTIWCGFWANGVIGQYFFENDVGLVITANSEHLKSMIIKLFWPYMRHIVYVTFERAI